MLIINDKNVTKNVTRGAYEQFYKPLGYKPFAIADAEITEIIEEPIVETVEEVKKENEKEEKVSIKKTSKNTNKRGAKNDIRNK